MTHSKAIPIGEKKRIIPRTRMEKIGWVLVALVAVALVFMVTTNPNFGWDVVAKYFTAVAILKGLVMTIVLTIVAMLLGTLIGLFLAILSLTEVRPFKVLADTYINFFRGTPVLVQLIFWFNIGALYPELSIGIPFTSITHAIDINALIGPITAAIIGLSLNEGAYMAEFIRGGFNSVERGQFEAADSLGLKTWTKIRRVIVPQAMPSIIPATGNQFIGMFKETALVSVLGVSDLLQSAQLIYARNYETIPLLIVASIWYLIMTLLLSYPQARIEKHYSRSKDKSATVTEAIAVVQGGEGK